MEKEDITSRLIDYIDGQLTEDERREIESMMASNEEVRAQMVQLQQLIGAMANTPMLDAQDKLRSGFDQALSAEQARLKEKKQLFFAPTIYRIAAGMVLVVSMVLIGYWVNRNIQQERELTALRAEMEQTKQLMLSMLGNDQSASQRMRAVNVAMDFAKADDDIIRALSETMMKDPNTNVRLAALDALSRFSQNPPVRNLLVASLSSQDDPMVQIALIQLLVKMKEGSVVDDLKKIIDDAESIPAVKDEAYTGILELS